MKSDLETLVIEGLKNGDCSIERALLVVSGLDERGIRNYQQKLDSIQDDFERWHSEIPERARALFDYLWETKPNRYSDDFLLANVIDNHLADDKHAKVGNCLGLTSLYTVLGTRLGLEMAVLFDEEHILSLLSYHGQEIVIENTKNIGFDCNLKERQRFQKGDLKILVSYAFSSRGNAKQNLGDLKGVIQDHNKALELKPDYAYAFSNRGVAKADLGNLKGAIKDYNKAIELKPDDAFAFYNRGLAKYCLGDLEGAKRDSERAHELNPTLCKHYISLLSCNQ